MQFEDFRQQRFVQRAKSASSGRMIGEEDLLLSHTERRK